ncbi:hypothetical protein HMPREF1983_01274 [Gemella bergeri ATCC 700627]|uniref:Uncharacterized protein n=1 Tax=Gemella bergeri ATCC 700627 TaxID=1321820 RepID=U2QKZ5_9BACL|nr:hypothetical protein [Gemella bergeri]ERK56894.1 hypothetical protein HMPREF1983_01274 [Gemella bergeri ATCC 700627]
MVVSIKTKYYGYSINQSKERIKNIAYTIFPNLENIDNLLNDKFDTNEKVKLLKYILTKLSKKLNSELRESNKCFTIIEREVLS